MKKAMFSREKIYQSFIDTEVRFNPDTVEEVVMACKRLKYTQDGQNALIWLVRFLVRTHPDPRPIFEHTAEILDAYDKEWTIISTIFKNEIDVRYTDLAKNEDRK